MVHEGELNPIDKPAKPAKSAKPDKPITTIDPVNPIGPISPISRTNPINSRNPVLILKPAPHQFKGSSFLRVLIKEMRISAQSPIPIMKASKIDPRTVRFEKS